MESEFGEELAVWIKAIDWDLASSSEWTRWAYEQMEQQKEPPGWVIDLATSSTKQEALERLREWKSRLRGHAVDDLNLTLGYLFARYRSGELQLHELLQTAGDEADIADANDPPCETYYRVLNQVEGGHSTTAIDDAVRTIFEHRMKTLKRLLASIGIDLDSVP
jgi:hypothetical protein